MVDIQIGNVANFGEMTTDGWAYQFNGNLPDEVRLKRFPLADNVDYETTMNGWQLLPVNGTEWDVGVDMHLADYTSNPANSFVPVYPKNHRRCLRTADASLAHSIQSNDNWTAGLPFMLYVQRDAQSPPHTQWYFQFGGDPTIDGSLFGSPWLLQWSREDVPMLRAPGGHAYKCLHKDMNAQEYQDATELRWVFYCIDGDLWIWGKHLRSVWIIPNVGIAGVSYPLADTPYNTDFAYVNDGPVTMAATASGFSFAVSPRDYESHGTLVTDWIDTWQTITSPIGTVLPQTGAMDADEFFARIYGTIPADCTADLRLYATRDGFTTNSQAQFALVLTNTPVATDAATHQTAALQLNDGPVTVAGVGTLAVTAAGLLASDDGYMAGTVALTGAIGTGGAGNILVTITSALFAEGSQSFIVAVADGDTGTAMAAKCASTLNADTSCNSNFTASSTTNIFTVTSKAGGYTDATFSVAITNAVAACSGLTLATSTLTWNPDTVPMSADLTVVGTTTVAGVCAFVWSWVVLPGAGKRYSIPLVDASTPTMTAAALANYLNTDATFTRYCVASSAGAVLHIVWNTLQYHDPGVTFTLDNGVGAAPCIGIIPSASTWEPVTFPIQQNVGDTPDMLVQRMLVALANAHPVQNLFSVIVGDAPVAPGASGDGVPNILTLVARALDAVPGVATDPTLTITFVPAGSGLSSTTLPIGFTPAVYGTNTPFIGAFEVIRMPQYGAPPIEWYSVNPWYEEGTLDQYKAWSANQATLYFRHWEVFPVTLYNPDGYHTWPGGYTTEQSLATLFGGLTAQVAVLINLAYDFVDDVTGEHLTPQFFRRFTGLSMFREEVGGCYDSPDDPRRLQLRVHSRYAAFTRALGLAPALHGLTADAAIATVAQWSGVLPRDIRLGNPLTLPGTPVTNYTDAPDGLLTDAILTDPGKRYYESTWQPTPQDTADTWIQKITQRFPNVRAEFYTDGLLYIWENAYSNQAPVVEQANSGYESPHPRMYTTSASVGTTPILTAYHPLAALAKIKLTRNYAGMVNKVVVQGETPEGNPLYAVMIDSDSLTNTAADNYIGRLLPKYLVDPSLRNQYDVDRAAAAAFLRRESGHPKIELFKQKWAGWLLIPGELILLQDVTTALATYPLQPEFPLSGGGTLPIHGEITVLVSELHLTLGDNKAPNTIVVSRLVCDTYIP